MVRALRGEEVERTPAWMMRQAGRYMQVYKDFCQLPGKTTFRDRSEVAENAVEVSLQPWRAFQPDGVILFSDILTPLTGMGVPFDIDKLKGPIIHSPIRDAEALKAIRPLEPAESMSFVGEALRNIRSEVSSSGAATLGFVGAPFTLATYIVEGKTTTTYSVVKKMGLTNPQLLHAMLASIADSVADYVRYQADNGAQVVQMFDSWGCTLPPADYDAFSAPYMKRVIDSVKETHPDLPLIVYASNAGGHVERIAATGCDCVSVDTSVDLRDARARVGPGVALQGNLDPVVLLTDDEATIRREVQRILDGAEGHQAGHVFNLGHGVMRETPERAVGYMFDAVRELSVARPTA